MKVFYVFPMTTANLHSSANLIFRHECNQGYIYNYKQLLFD